MDINHGWDVARYGIKMYFGWISLIATVPGRNSAANDMIIETCDFNQLFIHDKLLKS